MKKTRARKQRLTSETQLAGLRTSTTERKQATVERLRAAIVALQAKKQAITVQSVYEECGLRYAAIYRNAEALDLFRANSTHLLAQKKSARRKGTDSSKDPAQPSRRDPLLHYRKPQLAARLREAQQHVLELEQQQAILVEAGLKREARIAELEAKLMELEPYRDFVEQIRVRMHQEEQGRFGNLPPSV
jgi:hypothetical protein